MSARTPVRRSAFASGLARQVAARGAQDMLYKQLSDHWTTIIQELYPVWIVLGPGLASPACIDVHSRTVYLDSDELIGTRQEILDGNLDRYRIRVCFGAAFHEVGHAKHTLRFVNERLAELAERGEGQLALDCQLLEEPRMEAHLFADYPASSVRGRFIRDAVRAAVASVILPRFAAQVEQAAAELPVTRDMCGRAMSYLAARSHYGACDASDLHKLEPIWEEVLGLSDTAALHDLYARLICVPDGDTDPIENLAREYRAIIGPPDPAPQAVVIRITRGEPIDADADVSGPGNPNPDSQTQGASEPGNGEGQDAGNPESGAEGAEGQAEGSDANGEAQGDGDGDGETTSSGSGDTEAKDAAGGRENPATAGSDQAGKDTSNGAKGQPAGGPTRGSLADALRDAAEHAQAGQLEQFDHDVNLKDVLDRAASLPRRQENQTGQGTGAPAGRMPDRGVDRPPMPDEARAAAVFASRLERARTASFAAIEKRTPGGRFNSRQYIRALAQRQHGRPITALPWSIQRRKRNPIRGPHVIFIVDTSGSMAQYEYALGPIVWIIDSGLRKIGGRMATGVFGDSAKLLWDGRHPLANVPAIQTGGGTAFAGDALEMCAAELDMQDQARPRLAYILSDGGWYDTKAGMAKIQSLAAIGVPTIHISLLVEPLSVLAARISVIRDPADALRVVAEDSVALLQNPRAIPTRAATHA